MLSAKKQDPKSGVSPGRHGGRKEEDAVQGALLLWEERERARAAMLASVDAAEEAVARGEGRVITQESMRELAREVKERGRKRLTAEFRDKEAVPLSALGRRRDHDLRPGLRSFAVGEYVIVYRVRDDDDVLTARVLRGRRDLPALLH